jgi:hypothetical protein
MTLLTDSPQFSDGMKIDCLEKAKQRFQVMLSKQLFPTSVRGC